MDKPAGVPAQPTLTTIAAPCPSSSPRCSARPVTLVHRLDRETSGVTVLARTPAAAAALAEAFRDRARRRRPTSRSAPRARRRPRAGSTRRSGRTRPAPGCAASIRAATPAATRYRTLRARPARRARRGAARDRPHAPDPRPPRPPRRAAPRRSALRRPAPSRRGGDPARHAPRARGSSSPTRPPARGSCFEAPVPEDFRAVGGGAPRASDDPSSSRRAAPGDGRGRSTRSPARPRGRNGSGLRSLKVFGCISLGGNRRGRSSWSTRAVFSASVEATRSRRSRSTNSPTSRCSRAGRAP